MLVIYYDFSGYTDMAIGLGKILGFSFPENFDSPYLSESIMEFWRRWHMSLSSWFRDYVFYPLEFARRKSKTFRLQTHLIIIFLLTGLWHGPGWNFVVWGLYYGIIQAIESLGWGKTLKSLPAFFRHTYTLFVVMIGWALFRLPLSDWRPFFASLLGRHYQTSLHNFHTLRLAGFIPYLMIAIALCLPWKKWLKLSESNLSDKWIIASNAGVLMLFVVSIGFVLINGYQAFMYFQF